MWASPPTSIFAISQTDNIKQRRRVFLNHTAACYFYRFSIKIQKFAKKYAKPQKKVDKRTNCVL
jgi:hypothetical protein